jgi:hypothetical protein
MQGNAEKYRRIQSDPGTSKRLQERTAKNRAIQENAEPHRFTPEISRKIQGV